MPQAVAPKGQGRPKGLKNGEDKPVKPEAPSTHTLKTRGKYSRRTSSTGVLARKQHISYHVHYIDFHIHGICIFYIFINKRQKLIFPCFLIKTAILDIKN